MSRKILRIVIFITLATGVYSFPLDAQTISSDPNFRPEGTKAYACTTPKGRKTTCNKWLGFTRLSGWQRKCVYPDVDSMLMKVAGYPEAPYLEPPETGCAALFSDVWADTRNWAAKNQKKERRRRLKEAHFNQYVEVKEAGSYELNSCMVRNVDAFAGGFHGGMNKGGITTMLMQWHPNDKTSVHLVLPNNAKTLWGPIGDPAANIPFRVYDLFEEPPETAPPGTEMAITSGSPHASGPFGNGSAVWVNVFYQNGLPGGSYDATEDMAGQPLDGFHGHAGIGSKYNMQGTIIDEHWDAYWTCYSETLYLDPGFYIIRTEIEPFMHMVDGEYVGDYTGYGAVSNVYLRHITALGAN